MSDNKTLVRRHILKPLPSRRKHVLLVLCFITLIVGGTIIIGNFLGQAEDARPKGIVKVPPPPFIPVVDRLSEDSRLLPDLFAGEVPRGENPTRAIQEKVAVQTQPKLDALGNPIGESAAGETAASLTIIRPTNASNASSSNMPSSNTQLSNVKTINIDSSPHINSPFIKSVSRSPAAPRTITIDGKAIDGSAPALTPAPIPGLTRNSTYGAVPMVSSSGQTSFLAYKRPYTPAVSKKPVSIIIGGLGVNRSLTQMAIDTLPADVTLAFAAHAGGLQNWINKARAKGHEVMIELPMESADFNSQEPGAGRTLMASRNVKSNPRHLNWLLSRAQGYFGVTNYNGDVFLTRSDMAAPLLNQLGTTGLGFVFDGSISAPSLSALAASAKLPYATGYNLIDIVQETSLIKAELGRLSETAKLGAAPIGIGFTYPETIAQVKSWAQTLDAEGLELAPASHRLR